MPSNNSLIHALLSILPEKLITERKEQVSYQCTCPAEPIVTSEDIRKAKEISKNYSSMQIINEVCQLRGQDKVEENTSNITNVRASGNLPKEKSAQAQNNFLEDKREEAQTLIEFAKAHFSVAGKAGPPLFLKQLEDNTQSAVLIVRRSDLRDRKGSENLSYILKSKDLKDQHYTINAQKYYMCADGKYSTQRSAASLGSGFFISKDMIATAAHVLFPPFIDLPLQEVRFITNYKVVKGNAYGHFITVPKKNVYKPVSGGLSSKDFYWSSFGKDWALVKVKREDNTPANAPFITGFSNKIPKNQNIYGLGYGLGLPLKISYSGSITDVQHPDYFKCNLDLFSGNSGSPIFDATTHQAIGIIIRGQKQFVFGHDSHKKNNKPCLIPHVYSDQQKAEICQRMDPIIKRMNELSNPASPTDTSIDFVTPSRPINMV